MGGLWPEICRASYKYKIKILVHCCILLDFLCEFFILYCYVYLYFKKKKVKELFYPVSLKHHRPLDGSQPSPPCPSGNIKMWVTTRTEH